MDLETDMQSHGTYIDCIVYMNGTHTLNASVESLITTLSNTERANKMLLPTLPHRGSRRLYNNAQGGRGS